MGQIENKRLLDEIIDSTERISKIILSSRDIQKCLSDIICFDETLFIHSANVAFLSLVIGIAYYSEGEELYELVISALLHDYGKIYIPERILNKPGKLKQEERKIIELHPMVGYSYLKSKTYLPEKVLESIKFHHEKVDGSGYGLMVKGASIPEYSRIISISDVYDAMASDRVYHRKISKKDIYKYLLSNRGKHFDQSFVSIFFSQLEAIETTSELENMQAEFQKKLRSTYFFLLKTQ